MEFLEYLTPITSHQWGIGSVVLLISIPLVVTRLLTTFWSWRELSAANQKAPGQKRGPTRPTTIPLIGHIVSFLLDGPGFLFKTARYYGRGIPVRVHLATFPSYVISGPELVSAFLKDSTRSLTPMKRSLNYMEHAFGCPHDLVKSFATSDDKDMEQQIHSALQNMLSGPRLGILSERYQQSVKSQVLSVDAGIGDEWVELPDLCTFVETHVFQAATRTIFGPSIVDLNPTLAKDFWNFNKRVKTMFLGIPAWANRTAIRARDDMTEDIKRWQRHAEKNCNIDEIPEDVEWEEYYGSKSTRIRQQLLTKRGITNESARAAENLSMMWATNANSIPAACWFLLQTLNDPSLQARVRKELDAVRIHDAEETNKAAAFKFDITGLTESPLCQSVYAEVLRLGVAAMIVREPTHDNLALGDWKFKKDEFISVPTNNELMDPDFWNSGTPKDPHPLDKFWADRFLVYPDDPQSGPRKDAKKQKAKSDGKPYFSMDGCTWNWIPYGGGAHLCPGRNFAKREIMLTSAIMLTAFDIELLTDTLPKHDKSLFGFGTLPPIGKAPCRIRRRQL